MYHPPVLVGRIGQPADDALALLERRRLHDEDIERQFEVAEGFGDPDSRLARVVRRRRKDEEVEVASFGERAANGRATFLPAR